MDQTSPNLTLSPGRRARQALRQWIDRGILVGGQSLPSERQLGDQLKISRTVVRRVVDELMQEGLVVKAADGRRSVRVAANPDKASSAEKVLGSTIVLLAADSEPPQGHQQPGWLEHMSHGAVVASRQAGRNVLVMNPKRMASDGLDWLLSSPPLGVIMPALGSIDPFPGQEVWLRRLVSGGIPVVAYGDSPGLADFDRVMADHEGGSYELTKWVIAQGRKRILNLSGKQRGELYWYKNRLRGYERAIKEAGLKPMSPVKCVLLNDVLPEGWGDWLTIEDKFDIQKHQMAGYLAPLLSGPEPIDAIMLSNDGPVGLASAALKLLGREPGRDVLLVGYDNIWADCEERVWESVGPAATVDKCNAQIGQELVRLLMDRIEKRLPPEPQRRVVPSRLVVMEQEKSTG